jgi:histone H3/H4
MSRTRKDRIIPVAPVRRLIRKAGARRVSKKGAERLVQILEEVGEYLAGRALEITEYAGHKTITEREILLAYNQWRKSL